MCVERVRFELSDSNLLLLYSSGAERFLIANFDEELAETIHQLEKILVTEVNDFGVVRAYDSLNNHQLNSDQQPIINKKCFVGEKAALIGLMIYQSYLDGEFCENEKTVVATIAHQINASADDLELGSKIADKLQDDFCHNIPTLVFCLKTSQIDNIEIVKALEQLSSVHNTEIEKSLMLRNFIASGLELVMIH